MLPPSFYVVFGCTASAILLGWDYFRRYEIPRPPVGVFGLGDVAIMIGAIVALPYLYLTFPLWLVAGVFALGILTILYFTAEPVLRSRLAIWSFALVLLGADFWTRIRFGEQSNQYLAINDAVLVIVVVGTTNVWAQSGMKARDAAVLGGILALYDLVATSLLPLTTELLTRLAGMPLSPILSWGTGGERLAIGLGDLLLASVFPLVMRKGFTRSAGIAAIAINLGTIFAVLVYLELAGLKAALPLMTALGPLMVAQYVFWARRTGQERTTWQYLQAEPRGR